MFDPTGPLPAAVYWRRRVVAMSGFATILALAVWSVTGLLAAPLPPPAPAQAKPAPPPPNPIPQDCTDQAVRVAVEPVKPEFRLSERAVFRMSVTNTGNQPCRRDINRMLRELVVSGSDGQRVWSSNDCFAESTNEMPILQPGEMARNDIAWLLTTSAPGCPLRSTPAQAGEYTVIAKLGPLASAPAPFRLGT